jgi:CRISPR-associated protein Cas5t
MLGIRVTVPIACFRKGLAREYLETEPLPPPATCYGFLLSLVGETQRLRHIGCRVTPVLLNEPWQSVVLRTVWRVKSKPLGSSGNTRPDLQQLLSPVEIVVWMDSTQELTSHETLEQRVSRVLAQPETIDRFGGLSLGESTHLIDEVCRFPGDPTRQGKAFLEAPKGRLTMPVWVDHVGSTGTNWVTGDLVLGPLTEPALSRMPRIEPKQSQD